MRSLACCLMKSMTNITCISMRDIGGRTAFYDIQQRGLPIVIGKDHSAGRKIHIKHCKFKQSLGVFPNTSGAFISFLLRGYRGGMLRCRTLIGNSAFLTVNKIKGGLFNLLHHEQNERGVEQRHRHGGKVRKFPDKGSAYLCT